MPQIGDVLKNGRFVIAVKKCLSADDEHSVNKYIVLAVAIDTTYFELYATWRCTNLSDTCNGYYFASILDAAKDFERRG